MLIALVVIVLFCLVCALPFMSFRQEVDQVMQGFVVREGQREESVTIQLQGTKYINLWSEDGMGASIRVTDGDGTLLFYGFTIATPMPATGDYVWSTYNGLYNKNGDPDFDIKTGTSPTPTGRSISFPDGTATMLSAATGNICCWTISGERIPIWRQRWTALRRRTARRVYPTFSTNTARNKWTE